jgi:hypothetical protein
MTSMLKLLMLKSIGWDDSTKAGDVHINFIYLTKFVAYKFISEMTSRKLIQDL